VARGARGRVDFGDSEVEELEDRQPFLMSPRRRSTHLVRLLEEGAEELGDGAAKGGMESVTPASVRRVFGNKETLAAGAEDEHRVIALLLNMSAYARTPGRIARRSVMTIASR
jgi:hypothetical protein